MIGETTPFTCRKCGYVSFRAKDKALNYCERCHDFVGDPVAVKVGSHSAVKVAKVDSIRATAVRSGFEIRERPDGPEVSILIQFIDTKQKAHTFAVTPAIAAALGHLLMEKLEGAPAAAAAWLRENS